MGLPAKELSRKGPQVQILSPPQLRQNAIHQSCPKSCPMTCGEVSGFTAADSVVGRVVRLWWSAGIVPVRCILSELPLRP